MIGLYSFVSKTTKCAQCVFNHMGITVSPITIGKALVVNAETASSELRARIKGGSEIGLMYNNLVIYNRKQEETELNKNELLQLTACGGYFLRFPSQSAQEINSIPDPTLLMSAGIGEVEGQAGFVDIDEYSRRPTPVGIPNKHLFRDNPKYEKLNPTDILNLDSIDIYYPKMVKGHLQQVLRKYAGEDMDLNPNKYLTGYKVPELFQIPVHKSQIFILTTHDLDGSTLEGNEEILQELITMIGAELEDMKGTRIPLSGDQMTVVHARSVHDLRIRDCIEYHVAYPYPWTGFLHYGFAAADAVRRANMGGMDAKDSAQFTRFARHLGRMRVSEKGGDYNVTHRLIIQIMEGHILPTFLEISKSNWLAQLRTKIRTVNWVDWIDKSFIEFYPPVKVDVLRTNALDSAQAQWQTLAEPISALDLGKGTPLQKEFLKKKDKLIKPEFL